MDSDYSSADAKKICTLIYGRRIHNDTWESWRKDIGIKGKKQKITHTQFLDLCAFALLRKDKPRKKLSWDEVAQTRSSVASYLQIMKPLPKKLSYDAGKTQERELVRGGDIANFLDGNAPHESTLYRKIPGFSRGLYYPAELIRAIVD